MDKLDKKSEKILVTQNEALSLYVGSLLDVSMDDDLLEDSVEKETIIDTKLLQQKKSKVVKPKEKVNYDEGDEAPMLDLSLFLPRIPSDEEITAIENKKHQIYTHELKQKIAQKNDENQKLKIELEQSLKTIEELSKPQLAEYSPEWANPSFQVMIFSVAGLKLALPVNDLNSIIVWDEKFINKMPGQPKWHLGIVRHQAKNVPVIDTLQQVIPSQRIATFEQNRTELKNVIIIDDERWGLACDKVIGIVTLMAEDVKWRSSRTSRRWLYGTVKEQMCALLDTKEFTKMLDTGIGSVFSC